MESLPGKDVVLPALYVLAMLSKGVDINPLGDFPMQYLTEPRCKGAHQRSVATRLRRVVKSLKEL